MDFRKFENSYVLRLDKGEEIVETIKKFCETSNIRLGSMSGLGAVESATLGLFDPKTKKYYADEIVKDMEISSLIGNISTMNGEVYLHIHATMADIEHKTYGGHLSKAVVSLTCELIIHAVNGEIDREFSEEIGLNLIKFI